MATSPLFGWEEPDDTDLVKDGAAAIRTLGNAIDTSMGDLLGGTSGQVLSKASNTDMDFIWVAQDDSNAIQNAIVDAKGDLIAATAADTPARLAVGSNDELLIADSTASTGLKWGKPKGYGCSIYKSGTAQTIATNALTALTWETENWDTNAFHSTSTNTSRITIPAGLGGLYQVNAMVSFSSGSATGTRDIYLGLNGSSYYSSARIAGNATHELTLNVSSVMQLVAGDYVEIFVYQNSGSSTTVPVNSGGYGNSFSVGFLGA